jgi:hypothetical protein
MPAHVPLYQETFQTMLALTRQAKVRTTSVCRLALLVTGMIAAQSCVLSRIAAELLALDLTEATLGESIQRRLRRTLSDAQLTAATCYEPILRHVIDWAEVARVGQSVLLIVDESTREDTVHLFRMSLAYWGGALPLAWASWEQNVPQPDHAYWTQVDAVLNRVAALVPAHLEVMVLADRAFDIPPFIDRVAERGWHWLVRAKAESDLRFRDAFGQEADLAGLVRYHLPGPNHRWKIRGQVFKKAGWREASVVAIWAPGYAEPLVVLSDLPPRWDLLAHYRRRFWIEPGFRNDKSHGWQWEASQVPTLARQQTLLLAFAWASLLTLCLGVAAAQDRLAAVEADRQAPHPETHGPRRPQHARASIFTLGLQRARALLYQTLRCALTWHLPDIHAPSWTDCWFGCQFKRFLFQTVRP